MTKVLAAIVLILFVTAVLHLAYRAGMKAVKKRKQNRNGRI